MTFSRRSVTWSGGVLGLFFLAALFLYSANASRAWVGATFDDARYVLMAKSFLTGRLVALDHPAEPPLAYHFPGFGLLLVPFVATLEPHWDALKGVPLALTLLAGFLFWRWLRRRLGPWESAFVAGWFLFSRTTVGVAGQVMAEPLFLVLTLLVFLLLGEEPEFSRRDVGAGAALAFAVLVRPEGLVLLASVALTLIAKRQWRRVGRTCLPAILVFAVYVVRTRLSAGVSTGYWTDWLANAAQLSAHAWNWLLALLARSVLQLPMPESRTGFGVGLFVCAIAAALIVLGGRRARQSSEAPADTERVTLFVLLYLLMHCLWPVLDRRFTFACLPFVFYFLFEGVGVVATAKARLWIAGIAVAGYAAAVVARPAIPEIHRPPVETFRWLEQQPGIATLASESPQTLYLYTGKKGYSIQDLASRDREEFRYRLLVLHVDALLYAPYSLQGNTPSMKEVLARWSASRRWVATTPSAFRLAFQSDTDRTTVVRVSSSASFQAAFEQVLRARTALESGDIAQAGRLSDAAIAREPTLCAAWNVKALVQWLGRRDAAGATSALQRALAIHPGYAPAWLLWARIEKEQGHLETAQTYFDKTLAVIQESAEFSDLAPAAAAERPRRAGRKVA